MQGELAKIAAEANGGELIVIGHGGVGERPGSQTGVFVGGSRITARGLSEHQDVEALRAEVQRVRATAPSRQQTARLAEFTNRLEEAEMAQAVHDALSSSGVANVYFVSCNIGRDPEFLHSLANVSGVPIEAHNERLFVNRRTERDPGGHDRVVTYQWVTDRRANSPSLELPRDRADGAFPTVTVRPEGTP